MIVSPDSMKLLGNVQENQRKAELLEKLDMKAEHLAAEGRIVDNSCGRVINGSQWRNHFLVDAMHMRELGGEFRKVCPDAPKIADALEERAIHLAFFAGSCIAGLEVVGSGHLQAEVKALESAIEALKK